MPQISEHWPKKTPGVLHRKLTWFKRPGTASALIPKEGIVHEWRTSAAEIKLRICEFMGIAILLSTSNKRNELRLNELFKYESNSMLLKSEYS